MITCSEIINTVALAFDVTPELIRGKSRAHEAVQARHVALHLAYKYSGMGSPVIAQGFGRPDHTAVLYAVDNVRKAVAEDAKFAAVIRALEQSIEFKIDMSQKSMIEVLPLARDVYVNPRRAATMLSLHQIVALASTWLDLWEIATGAEALVEALAIPENGNQRDMADRDQLVAALSDAVTDHMAALRGETNLNIQETNDAQG
jgi:hypothetical protein